MSLKQTLKQKITEAVKQAMRAQDRAMLSALRLIQAEIKQKEVDQCIDLTDTDVVIILDKMMKKRHDAISQFKQAKRQDLVDQEQYELDVIQQFLPQALTKQELDMLILQAIADTKAKQLKDMSEVMHLLRPQVMGRVNMKQLSDLVRQRLL